MTVGSPTPIAPRELDGGLVLRSATPDDEEQIVALSLEAHGGQEAWGLRHVTARYGIEAWTVVCDGDRVVSTCMLMEHEAEIGGPPGGSARLPIGQIEYVATDPDYRRRNLVREQFDAHHQRSTARGHLVQFIAGIPYFYRRLGYSYGVSYPTVHRLPGGALTAHGGWEVRRAEAGDLPVVKRLHERALAAADLRVLRHDDDWAGVVDDRDNVNGLYVAALGGDVRGWMRFVCYPTDEICMVVQAGTTDLAAAEVLTGHAVELSGDLALYLLDRPGDPYGAFVRSAAFADLDEFNAIYTRIPDPVALLDALRPVLDARLSASELASTEGELVVSLYSRSIRLTYRHGAVDAIEWAPGVEEPDGVTSIGVPPDALDALLLGRFGASGLAARVDDVTLGRLRAVADVLFPPLVADVVGVV